MRRGRDRERGREERKKKWREEREEGELCHMVRPEAFYTIPAHAHSTEWELARAHENYINGLFS